MQIELNVMEEYMKVKILSIEEHEHERCDQVIKINTNKTV